MIDISGFHGSTEFHDATLLLSSSPSSLEQKRLEMQTEQDRHMSDRDTCKKDSRKGKTATDPGDQLQPHPAVTIALSGLASSSSQPIAKAPNWFQKLHGSAIFSNKRLAITEGSAETSTVEPAPDHGTVLVLPVHQLVLSTQSLYFKNAISNFISDRAAVGRNQAYPVHPIITVHEEDVVAAQSVLQCLYTGKVESIHNSASQLMQRILVSNTRYMII